MNQETTTSLIDTALAAGSATALDPEERRLQELVLAVRDDVPSPHPDFKLRMDARVAAGFPRRRRRLALPTFERPRLAALGAAASVLIALVVSISVFSRGSDTSAPSLGDVAVQSEGGSSSTAAAAPSAKAAPQSADAVAPSSRAVAPAASGGVTESIAPIAPQPGGFVGGDNRKVERSAAIVLAPEKDKLSEVGDQVIAVTDRYRGFVMNSSVTSSAEQASNGSFDLRIPVRNLRPALRDLSALADVKSRTENAADVTASFVSARTRLQELNAERRSLLRRLENATTDQQSAALRARIRIVNAQIDAQTAQLNELRRRTNYATVSVALEAKAEESGGTGGIGDGARDLRDSLVDAANLSLRVLGVALPIAILIALLWGASGWFNRRRREAVLDAPRSSH